MRIEKNFKYLEGDNSCFGAILNRASDPLNNWHIVSEKCGVLKLQYMDPAFFIVVKVGNTLLGDDFGIFVDVTYFAKDSDADFPEPVKKLLEGFGEYLDRSDERELRLDI
jgi:hypothetical protein